MTALLLDQGLPRSTAAKLRERSWSVVHVAEIGLARASDQSIIDYARRHGYHVVTLDADFHALVAVAGANGPSVLRLRIEGLKGDELAALLQRIWPRIDEAMSAGAFVTVTETQIRIKRLPIV
ncbi:MAG: DUF5615 family PIN-like protein [Rhodocyclaceae bacterium]